MTAPGGPVDGQVPAILAEGGKPESVEPLKFDKNVKVWLAGCQPPHLEGTDSTPEGFWKRLKDTDVEDDDNPEEGSAS